MPIPVKNLSPRLWLRRVAAAVVPPARPDPVRARPAHAHHTHAHAHAHAHTHTHGADALAPPPSERNLRPERVRPALMGDRPAGPPARRLGSVSHKMRRDPWARTHARAHTH